MRRLYACLLCAAICLSVLWAGRACAEKSVYGELWGYRLFCEDAKWGIMDADGAVCVEAIYDHIVPDRFEQAFRLYLNDSVGAAIVTQSDLFLLVPLYDRITTSYRNHTYMLIKNDLFGLVDLENNVLVEPISNGVIITSDRRFIAEIDGRYYLMDCDGQKYNEEGWEKANYFSEGLAAVCVDGLFGYIDEDGVMRLPTVWNEAYRFSDGVAWVRAQEDGPYALIDTDGAILFETELTPITDFSEQGTAIVRDVEFKYISGTAFDEDGEEYDYSIEMPQFGIIRKDGTLVNGACYWFSEYPNFDDGDGYVTATKDDSYWGMLDIEGNEVVPFVCAAEYRSQLKFRDGYVVVNTEGESYRDALYHIYDTEGTLQYAFQTHGYYMPDHFSEGMLLIATSDDEKAYIDPHGNIMLGPDEGYGRDFSEGVAPVYRDGKYGYIDTTGEFAIPAQFDGAYDFKNGFATVRIDGVECMINHQGEVVAYP